jgi:molybdenum cofactor guanylyltransferase
LRKTYSDRADAEEKMLRTSARGAIVVASGMEDKTIARQFAPSESGTLLEYVLDSVWTVADELFVVFPNEPKLSTIESISPFGVKVLSTSKSRHVFESISDAFRSSHSEHCLLVTERVPLLKPSVALTLFERAQGYDLAIPRWKNGNLEPMLAVYRRNAFTRLASGNSSEGSVKDQISKLVDQLFAVRYVSVEEELKQLDPELDSFLEVKNDSTLRTVRSKASLKSRKGRGTRN